MLKLCSSGVVSAVSSLVAEQSSIRLAGDVTADSDFPLVAEIVHTRALLKVAPRDTNS